MMIYHTCCMHVMPDVVALTYDVEYWLDMIDYANHVIAVMFKLVIV